MERPSSTPPAASWSTLNAISSSRFRRPWLVDPITLAVIFNGLQQICNEMDIAIERSSFCPIVSESRDRASGIYSTTGELISQGETGLPLFVGSMQFAVQAAVS